MKFPLYAVLFLFLIITSCKDVKQQRIAENEKDTKKKEIIFSNINKGWVFNSQPINSTAQSLNGTWAEWGVFLKELSQKPKSSIGAFQQKAKTLSKKVADLNNNIPITFDKPGIKSRIAVLTTKINSLTLYINLDKIPDEKVVALVGEINVELFSLQSQMDEIVRKNTIPKEEGESDLIQMLDTTRAIPTNKKVPNL